jgi:hypothetical protein
LKIQERKRKVKKYYKKRKTEINSKNEIKLNKETNTEKMPTAHFHPQ